MSERATSRTRLAEMVEATAALVFFYQAIRVLFSALFGLIYDAIFAEIVPMTTVGLLLAVVILALMVPLIAPRKPGRQRILLLVGAVLVFLARIPLTFNDPQVRLVASILVIAAAGLYLASRLSDGPWDTARALILALAVDQLLRAAGHTWDVTLRETWWPGQVVTSLALCLLAGWLFRQRLGQEPRTNVRPGLLGGLAWGGWLFLETSLLAFPNAIMRWIGSPESSYWVVAALLLAVTLFPLLQGTLLPPIRWGRWGALAAGVLLLLCLAVGGLMDGIVALLLILLAQWVTLRLLPNCFSPSRNGQETRPGSGLALGGIVFLVVSFAYAFAFTYAYTLELFRDMGLPIVLVAGLLVALPGLRAPAAEEPIYSHSRTQRLLSWGAGAALILLVVILAWPPKTSQPAAGVPLRVATYNIHYGYDTGWHLSLEAQAQAIEASGADVVALQEVDTGRPTSYMIDDALWLARRLGMEAVYLPCVERLTGIALLSRYPIPDSAIRLLPSELEQTGIIWAKLDAGGTPINAFAIWLGLEPEERARQLDAALPFLAAHPGPAVFGGDFNSTPDSPVYTRIADAGFTDPFVALGLGSPPTDPAINPTKRIDFVWLRELPPLAARVLDSTASDHRLVVVEATLQ